MDLSTEIAIIGSGVAGALVAAKLAQGGHQVIVLEAGPRITRESLLKTLEPPFTNTPTHPYPFSAHAPTPNPGSRDDYYVQSGPSLFKSAYLRVVGGTTWHWQGTVPRYLPEDFRLKSEYGVGVDWPLSYDELEPFYVTAEKELGVSGDRAIDTGSPRSAPYPMPAVRASYLDGVVARAVKPLGMTVVPLPQARTTVVYDGRPPCCGQAHCIPLCPIQSKYDATVHLKKAEARGARILDNAVVDRLDVGPDGKIVSAAFKRPDGSVGLVKAKYFFVAAHAIESAKLLLISRGDRAPDGVANSSGMVGRHLMDHPLWLAWALAKEPVYPFRAPLVTSGIEDFRRGKFRSKSAAYRIDLNNDGWSWPVGGPDANAAALIEKGLRGAELAAAVRERTSRQYNLVVLTEQLPDPQNRVEAAWDQRDALGIPRPKLTYRLDEYSRRGLEAARQTCRKIFDAVGCTEQYHTDEYRGGAHIAGTLRMGRDAKTSVVSRDLRAHDHANLYVVGSAVFPTIGTANPTLTIAALTLRAVDRFLAARN